MATRPALSERLRNAVDALLGVSAYEAPPAAVMNPDIEKQVRKMIGGNIQPLPTSRLRWYTEELEWAQSSCDNGNLRPAAQLCRAMRRDGTFKGLMRSRTNGLIRLPKRFYGDEEVANALRAQNGSRSVFDEMHPPSELKALDADGIELGVGIGEYVPVKGRNYPVLVRLEPEFLQFRWNENRWYFNSLAGQLPITPGDGRWVLHAPGGRQAPWNNGDWYALGRAFINKEHAMQYRANYIAKLANPARLAYAPAGATEAQRIGFFRKVLAWGVNTVLELPPGWEAKLLETNGRGWQVFQTQIDTSDLEFMICLAGQIVTTTGGSGFSNADVPAAIRQDFIQADGDELAYTINTQGLPAFIVANWGEAALSKATVLQWDTGTPGDKEKETRILGQAADAIKRLTESLAAHGRKLNVNEVGTRFGIPLLPEKDSTADLSKGDLFQYHFQYGIVTVNEARARLGLDPIEGGDEKPTAATTSDEPSAEGEARAKEVLSSGGSE